MKITLAFLALAVLAVGKCSDCQWGSRVDFARINEYNVHPCRQPTLENNHPSASLPISPRSRWYVLNALAPVEGLSSGYDDEEPQAATGSFLPQTTYLPHHAAPATGGAGAPLSRTFAKIHQTSPSPVDGRHPNQPDFRPQNPPTKHHPPQTPQTHPSQPQSTSFHRIQSEDKREWLAERVGDEEGIVGWELVEVVRATANGDGVGTPLIRPLT
ncbi:hypothetical protein BDK51DRAFT_48515 [Blyttiomyces helicus]|uniref:Uncharacterized protein n=1 Tax=Blyttiomyces helicus TaxID=388810 RepID=A0A4P9W5J3_9FUNG|nr:hypothetical protein BDK51DRAFT_48515 [Blyttiomyces helicus]|eukprot:RKO86593.1 hypothetical protein BDK51DRAFT_48515 [Blyttiomyces helicus]